ncbi:hypothetical protein Sru01_24080 [Sphaerisporangium rufum]|uniref:Uncharacterized protein n=1 Tax=Sphaerisporangium rufum TaxID=1381558 RepID=A0A919UXW6_9ACTN|nr:hypothetical protein Sru01_24080 [Sphaerisporangium rufum]
MSSALWFHTSTAALAVHSRPADGRFGVPEFVVPAAPRPGHVEPSLVPCPRRRTVVPDFGQMLGKTYASMTAPAQG